ncbi:MAG TPA: ferritin-like domain-containing protein [Bryobacteraceae bacterium]|nr:ferritin-like domain-containing protein [Bryobacteraceae bacterium]
MAAKVTGSEQLLNLELQDVYDAEKQLMRALPKMAKAASDEELRNALREHLEVTKTQVQRLEQLFGMMDMRARSRPCKGMRGIVEEGEESMAEHRQPELDAAIIGAGRRVEHYEMGAYEGLREMMRQMGNKEAADMIEQTLREEIQADKQLAQIGKRLFKEVARPRAEQTEQPRTKSVARKSAKRAPAQAKTKRAGRPRTPSMAAGSQRVSRVLTDPEEIRAWAEDRGAQPACVRGTGGADDVGMIRLDFPGWGSDEKLQPISWDKWFEKFDESGLALIVEEETATGQKSNFNKLVSRETAQSAEERGRTRSAH